MLKVNSCLADSIAAELALACTEKVQKTRLVANVTANILFFNRQWRVSE
jgi:hypothetical protein